mgnify:CR=1 FL=1
MIIINRKFKIFLLNLVLLNLNKKKYKLSKEVILIIIYKVLIIKVLINLLLNKY